MMDLDMAIYAVCTFVMLFSACLMSAGVVMDAVRNRKSK